MKRQERSWMLVTGLDEVQVKRDGKVIESFDGDDLEVELFDHNPSEYQP